MAVSIGGAEGDDKKDKLEIELADGRHVCCGLLTMSPLPYARALVLLVVGR